jgi:gluconate 2-dehydrogenase gamma chain
MASADEPMTCTRRVLTTRTAALAVVATGAACVKPSPRAKPPRTPEATDDPPKSQAHESQSSIELAMDDEEYRVLDAVLDRLLPKTKAAPGASDVGAPRHLRKTMAGGGVRRGESALLKRAVRILSTQCIGVGADANTDAGRGEKTKQSGDVDRPRQSFAQLSEVDQIAAVLRWQKHDDGIRAVEILLRTIIEALLSDPVHGVNGEERGWRYLGHTPGFPRPNAPTIKMPTPVAIPEGLFDDDMRNPQ